MFRGVLQLLTKLGQCPFLKHYLRWDEIAFDISSCDAALNNALGMFRVRFPLHSGAIRADLVAPWQLSIQIRTLKLIQANELRRQQEAQDLLESLSHLPDLPVVPLTLPSGTLPSPPTDPETVQRTLRALRSAQNAQDRAHDAEDWRQVMRAALAANDDATMIEVLQIARSELPEALKTLQRALERVVEDTVLEAEGSHTELMSSPQQDRPKAGPSTDSGIDGVEIRHSADTLDREFIETGIDALRRLSSGAELGLPSWTIT